MEEREILPERYPICLRSDTVKNGSVRGVARRKCRNCGRSYTGTTPKGAGPEIKRMAAHMYLEGNGFSAIGRMPGYSKVSVLNRVRGAGNKLLTLKGHSYDIPESVNVMEFDEMWHFVQKKVENYGFGLLLTDTGGNPSHSHAVIGIKKRSKGFVTK